jgi:spore maturation protein CgeB
MQGGALMNFNKERDISIKNDIKIDATILFLVTSDCSNEPIVKKYNLDAWGIEWKGVISALRQIFRRVCEYDYRRRHIEVGVIRANEEIVDIVKRERPKYVLWVTSLNEVLESTFKIIKQYGSKVIGWFFDDEFRFDTYSKWWIPYLDYFLTSDKNCVQKYKDLGANVLHFIVYSSPEIFRRLALPKRYDVSFVGSKIADREKWVVGLHTMGVSVKTFGRGWDCGRVPLEQMVEIYNTSRINLCFMKTCVKNAMQMKCKIFDICMCGGFLLCEYTPGIEEYYEIGREIVCFESLIDLKQKIEYYLRHEDEREQIAEAGYQRAIKDHNFQVRLAHLFQTLENFPKKNENFTRVKKAPWYIRRSKSDFHLKLAKAFLLENRGFTMWMNELILALLYFPPNIVTIYRLLWEKIRKLFGLPLS